MGEPSWLGSPASRYLLEAGLTHNHLFLYVLITACCVIEILLSLSDLGVVGPALLRQMAYHYGAFWPGLLDNWKPNYAAQPFAMFITYGFLHSGLVHLSVNMITLWSLGSVVADRANQRGLVIIYFFSSIGGAAVFALLAHGFRPMVGASGSLFGLLGAIMAWEYVDHRTDREYRRRVAKVIMLLTGLNLLLWWAMDGQLAWQTHLGGGVAGWIAALLIDRRPLED